MYNNFRYRKRTSVRFGGSNSSYSKPFRGNNARHINKSQSFGKSNQRKSQLEGADTNIFIKKAKQSRPDQVEKQSNTFDIFGVCDQLKVNINSMGYVNPTPIQSQVIRPILEGRDVIGLASTGTGKTAAFLIPLIDVLFKERNKKALIIVPTRELAVQINEEFRALSRGMSIFSATLIGGSSIGRQANDLKRGSQVVIATPGRLRDLIERQLIRLGNFTNIVLDEVDLMVDIGFIAEVRYFISLMPRIRQSLFFSATISMKVQEILQSFVTDPIRVSVKEQETSENVNQDIIRVERLERKLDQLHSLLIKNEFEKVLIFGRTKHGIEKLNRELNSRGFRVGAIHGNKSQGQRLKVLQSFKRNEIKILLATDVASRGLDIDNVTHVINYDLPQTYNDYVHRIGRTGRAGKLGFALTFVN
jgi:ATP-dependent RNA helicase RhlE